MPSAPRRLLKKAARKLVPARRKPARPCEAEVTIERIIVTSGRDPHDFLCQDCHTWVVETHYCGCWERQLFR